MPRRLGLPALLGSVLAVAGAWLWLKHPGVHHSTADSSDSSLPLPVPPANTESDAGVPRTRTLSTSERTPTEPTPTATHEAGVATSVDPVAALNNCFVSCAAQRSERERAMDEAVLRADRERNNACSQ